MKTILVVTVLTCVTGVLSGCVVAPAPYAYGPAPEYGPAYGPAPGYYAAPSVSVGVGFSDYGGGGHHGHGR